MATLDALPALIVVDCQPRHLGMLAHPMRDQIVGIADRLATQFRAHEHPVVWTRLRDLPVGRVDALGPEDLPEATDELHPDCLLGDADLRPEPRRRLNALDDGLVDALRDSGVHQIVLAGLTTGGAVESTARAAYDAGFNVYVVADGVADVDPRRHDCALVDSLPFVAEIGWSEEIEHQIR